MNNENKIEKPIELVIHETKVSILGALQNSNLPHFVLASIMKDIYTDIQNASNIKTNAVITEYQNSLKEDDEK